MKAKKSLGQNFLISPAVARTVAHAGYLKEGDYVLEIGPGKGILTKILLEKARVIAVEKDARRIPTLAEKFKKEIMEKKLVLIEGDVFQKELYEKKLPASFKVISNIPYYITGALFPFLFSLPQKPESITLMVQKEVALRVVARNKKETILSISIKAFGNPKLVKKIPAKAFSPRPKVDSAILHIDAISDERLQKIDEKKFFDIVKRGFAHKRKFLKRNIGGSTDMLAHCAIQENTRAEDLSLSEWLCLASIQ